MELQLIGLTIDFLGTVLLLLFLDPMVMTSKKAHNEEKIPEEKILRRYLMKRHFALIIIVLGFIIQLVSFFYK